MNKLNLVYPVLFFVTFSVSTLLHAVSPVLIKDINPSGDTGSFPSVFADLNGTLFFRAGDGVHGKELWKFEEGEIGLISDDSICMPIKTTNGKMAIVCLLGAIVS